MVGILLMENCGYIQTVQSNCVKLMSYTLLQYSMQCGKTQIGHDRYVRRDSNYNDKKSTVGILILRRYRAGRSLPEQRG